jgi:hypothetical protein
VTPPGHLTDPDSATMSAVPEQWPSVRMATRRIPVHRRGFSPCWAANHEPRAAANRRWATKM